MTFETVGAGEAFLLGRALFATGLAYLAVGNLLDLSNTTAYARSKGAPAPRLTVPVASLVLIAGATAVFVGAYPAVGFVAIIGFLVGVTPVMHDFWNAEDPKQANERFHFVKNVGLIGGAIALLALTGMEWPYAIGAGIR